MLRRCALLFALTTLAACDQPSPTQDLCAPGEADSGVDPEAGLPTEEDAGVPSAAPYCAPCRDLSVGAIDVAASARFSSEFGPLVLSAAPGGPPVLVRGALVNVPIGALLRASAASNNGDAARALTVQLVEVMQSLTFAALMSPPLTRVTSDQGVDEERTAENLRTAQWLGDVCAGALSLRTFAADPSLFALAQGGAPPALQMVLDRAVDDLPRYSINEQFSALNLAIAARMLGACGQLMGSGAATSAALPTLDLALGTQARDGALSGAFLDEQGQYDTNRQAMVLNLAMDTLRSVPASACASRMAAIQQGMLWLSGRVTPMGQVDSSNSRATCAPPRPGARTLALDSGAVFLALATGSVAFEPATLMDPPIASSALRMSAWAIANQGAPTCFP
jgi:hypothetical protein